MTREMDTIMTRRSSPNLAVEAYTDPVSMSDGMRFCHLRYEATYHTHWQAYPDVLFVARRSGSIVSTLGMELGTHHAQFGAERYFHLGPRMRAFLAEHRSRVVELGRFASEYQDGARVVFRAAIDYALGHDIGYFIAWANPSVIQHLRHVLGIPFWHLPLPINVDAVEHDTQWVTPPRGFFFRADPPELLLSMPPFWEHVPYPTTISGGG